MRKGYEKLCLLLKYYSFLFLRLECRYLREFLRSEVLGVRGLGIGRGGRGLRGKVIFKKEGLYFWYLREKKRWVDEYSNRYGNL